MRRAVLARQRWKAGITGRTPLKNCRLWTGESGGVGARTAGMDLKLTQTRSAIIRVHISMHGMVEWVFSRYYVFFCEIAMAKTYNKTVWINYIYLPSLLSGVGTTDPGMSARNQTIISIFAMSASTPVPPDRSIRSLFWCPKTIRG